MKIFIVAIYHNILWSKYKGGVFSALHRANQDRSITWQFFQIAETDGERVALGGVDLSYHQYSYSLFFKGPYGRVPRWQLIKTLFSSVLHSKADLIVLPGYDRPEFWAMLLACKLSSKKRAVFCDSTIHDRPPVFWKSLAKRLFFSQCHGFFGYGLRSCEYLMSLGVSQERISHRCQAAALPHSYSATAAFAARCRATANQMVDRPHFLYVGRLSPEKGLDVLLDAFVKLRQSFPSAELSLVGAGPLKDALAQTIAERDLAHRVHLVGSLDIAALSERYASATALILPSRSEPWGLVVNEALSYGCPVIVSDACGCVPELVLDGVTGYVFKTDSVEELAARMVQLSKAFTDQPAVAQRCLDVISIFTPENAAQQIIAGCQKILGVEQRA